MPPPAAAPWAAPAGQAEAGMHPDHVLPAGARQLGAAAGGVPCLFAPTTCKFEDAIGNVYRFKTRVQRKGRYPVLLSSAFPPAAWYAPRLLPVWAGYPFGDISYWVALVFTLGCVAWVVNGHYALYPDFAVAARGGGAAAAAMAVSVSALVGGTLFEVGSWLLYWEALNAEPKVVVGKTLLPAGGAAAAAAEPAVPAPAAAVLQSRSGAIVLVSRAGGAAAARRRALVLSSALDGAAGARDGAARAPAGADGGGEWPGDEEGHPLLWPTPNVRPEWIQEEEQRDEEWRRRQDARRRARPAGAPAAAPAGPERLGPQPPTADGAAAAVNGTPALLGAAPARGAAAGAGAAGRKRWRWFGLRLHDMGFAASFLQLIGATVFWVPCIFGAPRAYPPEGPDTYAAWDGVYWGLQVVGATFFIASSLLFMLEEQPAWWHPKPMRIGWHVGFWNLLGSIGFWLSGFFGLYAYPTGTFQVGGTAASTFWGSYCFLIGSYLQLLEAINKHQDGLAKAAWWRGRQARHAAQAASAAGPAAT